MEIKILLHFPTGWPIDLFYTLMGLNSNGEKLIKILHLDACNKSKYGKVRKELLQLNPGISSHVYIQHV